MKFLFFLFALGSSIKDASAQTVFSAGLRDPSKLNIDSNACSKWITISSAAISDYGRFVWYSIKNQPVGSQSIVFKSINSKWVLTVPQAYNAIIDEDERFAIFMLPGDKLCILDLENKRIDSFKEVRSYRLLRVGSSGNQCLVYHCSNKLNKLVIRDLRTGQEKEFDSVHNYLFNGAGDVLVLHTITEKDALKSHSVSWNTLPTGTSKTIWSSKFEPNDLFIGDFVFDFGGHQIVYLVKSDNTTIFYYKEGFEASRPLSVNSFTSVDSSLKPEHIMRFSNDGRRVFVKLRNPKPLTQNRLVNLNVWSYLDSKVQSLEAKEKGPREFIASLDIGTRKIVQLEHENEVLQLPDGGTDSIALLLESNGNVVEDHWNITSMGKWYVISTIDAKKKHINEVTGYGYKVLSPSGRFVIYYDDDRRSYYSYDAYSGKTKNITYNVNATWTGYLQSESIDGSKGVRGVAAWGENERFILLYDRNDIWQIDLGGDQKPLNITRGYGRRNKIVFHLGLYDYSTRQITVNEKLILTAFNLNDKQNGFFSTTLGRISEPLLLTMGPYLYCLPENETGISGMKPIRAKTADIYLAQRMSTTQSPNLFVTSDFKVFKPISNVYPEKSFKWHFAELHTFKMVDGRLAQGILYKPDNFNPEKKYPVIFHIYEKLTEALHAFRVPEPSNGNMNIAWFLNDNYLIFEPDIYYKMGDPGKSVFNSVVGAANYIGSLPFVDKSKMGIQGHSFGGYEVSHLVTQTNIFAAACSASGVYDFISAYGSLDGVNGNSRQGMYETGQYRVGATIWDRPDLYHRNSPIMFANRISTPILMMHGAKDPRTSFEGAIEFYTALRRLGKKCWLLEYVDGSHALHGQEAKDFTIRMLQFFDHYLCNKPAPYWMTKGVPQSIKGHEQSFELDISGSCGGTCPICKKPGRSLLK